MQAAPKGLMFSLIAGALMISGCNQETTEVLKSLDARHETPIVQADIGELVAQLDQILKAEQSQEWQRIKHWTVDLACLEAQGAAVLPEPASQDLQREDANIEAETNTASGPRIRLGAYYLQDGVQIQVKGAAYSDTDQAAIQGVGLQSATRGEMVVEHASVRSLRPMAKTGSGRCYKF